MILIIVSCGKTKEVSTSKSTLPSKPKVKEAVKVEKTASYEDFESFYMKFHKDSLFQISRIKFPLQGYDIDTSENASKWSKQNWVMHKAQISSVDTSKYKIEVQTNKEIRKERIFIEGGGFSTERVFKRINGKWYLTLFINEEM
ncbi:MAG: DUF4348 domain-containing protein [Salinivirgaceae bacterium]|nr:DUF4348 domain-containing protein [Salinivirgaceae bacterium]